MVICFAIILLFASILSNKIAGTIYSFEEALKQVAKGNKKVRISLRQDDTLRDVEKEFNNMMDILDTDEEKK